MKSTSTSFRLVFLLAFSLISFAAVAQGPQSIIQVPIASSRTEGAILYLPDDYATSSTNYPIIVFLHGIGEGGRNPASIYNSSTAGGPAYYIAHGQWPSSTINPADGLPYKFIVVSPQNNEGWSTTAPELDYVLSYMINNYRVDSTRLYLTGLSAGGEGITEYIAKNLGSGAYINKSHQIAAYVPMSAVVNGGHLIKIADTVVVDNVRIWGFGSPSDTHGNNTLRTVKFVNDKSHGFGVSTSYKGGHCCWNQFYNPAFTQSINGQSMNIYQWMLMYKRTYTAPGHIPPTVSTGVSQTIVLPLNSAPLKGTASGNAGAKISSVVWTQVSGPNIAVLVSPNSLSTDANGLISGTYIFKLSATDNNGMTSSSTVTTRVDMNPTANAGSNIVLISPQNSTSLNGTASSDPDGSIADYSWTKISGPNQGKISNANTATPTLSKLAIGIYIYQLTVKDNYGATATSQVSITVNPAPNQPPVANAGADQKITLPTNIVTLNGSASADPDGTIKNYRWSKVSGPASGTIAASDNVSTAVNGLNAGSYVFALTVTDNSGASSSDQISITVSVALAKKPPVVNAGVDQTITLPTNSYEMKASASDPDGTIAKYAWTKTAGPTPFTITNPAILNPVMSGLTTGTYTFRLTVTDNSGATTYNDINITVNSAPVNKIPVVNAGADQTITLPTNSYEMKASVSDPDGTIAKYAWTKTAGPASFTITNPAILNPVMSGLTAGTYTFRLTVTDNSGATTYNDINITVNSAPVNKIPVVNAGADQTITLPTNSYEMKASASDPDGTIAKYAWTKTAGPASFTITNPAILNPVMSGLTAGTYTFRLTVTDNSGAIAFNDINISVNSELSGTTTQTLNVSIYGGTNPYQDTHWNNWNVVTGAIPSVNIVSGKFNYDDGSASSISARLSRSQTVADNGAAYGGGMAPAQVLRYVSYSSTDRTLTLSGLTIGKTYDISLYSSRANPNNPTKFTVGSLSSTIATYNNLTNKVTFTSLQPNSNGQIVVTILRTASFSYINGFTIMENSGTASTSQPEVLADITEVTAETTESAAFTIYPNPVMDQLTIRLNNPIIGEMDIRLLSMSGQLIERYHAVKDQDVFSQTCYLKNIPKGTYVVDVKIGHLWSRAKVITKL